ncbi:MAG TPA: acyclic terpene utilization AtuA family protein [Acidimicrobiia bacterium]|nr:acyclic terpene utilization AtuA family protein [Acidimicrobiia bacterium]
MLRIANCSGFYGDRLGAAQEMVSGGPIDVLTGDYLAELTMSILWRSRSRDPDAGYATTFFTQMEEVLGTCLDRGIKIISNAGGLNPRGLVKRLEKLADDLGLAPRIASVEGDDLMPRLDGLIDEGHEFLHFDRGVPLREAGVTPLTANAYLGGWGITEALQRGADVVICGRVTDAALVVGPCAWHFGWHRDDWDALAGAVAAGHILECGPQATGGNYSFFRELGGLDSPGFPIAEVERDGSAVITKHPGSGGRVTVETVTAQLLYEIGSPRYLNPDVTAHFETIRLSEGGEDRVRVSGVKGSAPPPDLKVALNYLGGHRNAMTFGISGLDVEEKAWLLESALWKAVGGRNQFETAEVQLIKSGRPDPQTIDDSMSYLRFTVKDPDPNKVGRSFSRTAVELALANYPGLFLTTPPGDASPYAIYWPTTIPAELVPISVVVDGSASLVTSVAPPGPKAAALPSMSFDSGTDSKTERRPLGILAGARSGDKGGNANLGVWVRHAEAYPWLASFLTVDRLRHLLPEAGSLSITRFELPNLVALNFVIEGFLGDGVSSSTRTDPQAKSLGEFIRARMVDIPRDLLTKIDDR